ncbi:MAG: NYN domain-containing protein [bacterium]
MNTAADSTDNNVAILWDVENVAPNATPQMVSIINSFAARHGRLSVSFAFADWSRRNWKGSDASLAQQSFQLIHIPRARKNSSDISMVTHAMELLFLYPHISTYVLVTGDTDFRPLIVAIRRRGARSIVLCDSKNASEDLLALADTFQDYRDLLTEDDADIEDDAEEPRARKGSGGQSGGGSRAESSSDAAGSGTRGGHDGAGGSREAEPSELSRERAFYLLAETVAMMKEKNKTPTLGPVKIRLRLLNENFDEAKLGYKSWKSFVLAARDKGYVAISPRDNDLVLDIPESSDKSGFEFAEPFATLRSVVDEISRKSDGKPVPFATISKEMKNRNTDFRSYGYTRFKKLAEAAEKRGIIEVVREGLDLYAKPGG